MKLSVNWHFSFIRYIHFCLFVLVCLTKGFFVFCLYTENCVITKKKKKIWRVNRVKEARNNVKRPTDTLFCSHNFDIFLGVLTHYTYTHYIFLFHEHHFYFSDINHLLFFYSRGYVGCTPRPIRIPCNHSA